MWNMGGRVVSLPAPETELVAPPPACSRQKAPKWSLSMWEEAPASETLRVIREAGGTAEVSLCDVADAAAVQHMVRGTVEHFGRIDVLHANAAVPVLVPVDWIPQESEWDRLHSANLKGVSVLEDVIPVM